MHTTLEASPETPADARASGVTRARTETGPVEQWLTALASLRLTVALFALSIFLVFVGTLAQVDHDVWYVVEENYFRVWVAKVEWQTFVRLAEMFTKSESAPIAGGFYYPGGKLLGTLLFANLIAAHALRFKVVAKGARLTAGLVVLAVGVAATVGVIAGGVDSSLDSELSPAFCDGLWQALRAAFAGAALVGSYWSVRNYGRLRPAEWWLSAAGNLAMVLLSAYLFARPSVAPDDAGMRIVWQLTKCGGAAALCLLGCWMVFRQRAGVVLLHAGVALLLVNELVTDLSAVEGRMTIPEGGTSNYAEDIRHAELAVVIDEGDTQLVTVVPQNVLAAAARSEAPVSHPDLPFDLRVLRFFENSTLAPADRGAVNLATEGVGQSAVAIENKSVSGVSTSAGVNLPSAYVEALDKESGDSLGVWLVSTSFLPVAGSIAPQPVPGEDPVTISLRFKRLYKPYSITLEDFRFDRYAGTSIPKNFQSDVVLRDPSQGVDRKVKIWMNNPLRYGGDTLYQSSYDDKTEAATVLQVVTNGGWMIPYVSCVFVGLGMLWHFSATLTRFARRRVEEAKRLAKRDGAAPGSAPKLAWRSPIVWAPALAAVLTLGYFAGKARTPADAPDAMAVQRFGALPVAEGGRIKPIDTLARTTLQAISARQEVKKDKDDRDGLPATAWLLDAISGRKGWDEHRVFRIESLELLDALDLAHRPGFFRYSYREVMNPAAGFEKQFDAAMAQRQKIAAMAESSKEADAKVEPLSLVQHQTLDLAEKLSLFHKVIGTFDEPQIETGEGADIRQQLVAAQSRVQQLNSTDAVRAVPPAEADGEWMTLYQSSLLNLLRLATKQPLDPAGAAWSDALAAYARGDADRFANSITDIEAAAEKYERSLQASPEVHAGMAGSERLDARAVRFEHFFNAFSPFYYCAAMYLVAFVLVALSWLTSGTWSRSLGRAAMAVIAVTLLVHTFALVGRVYISGRPPVTNLYSSAVFIGWAGVLMAVAYEAIYKLGVGGAVASALGFSTLVVAYYLSLDGDTYTVLQAVLDTQFWLATHVVCVTLGYAATFLAGFLGVGYLFAVCAPGLAGAESLVDKRTADQLVRMIYGTLCFAILFSFVGTVLGGLWADDSWGRFWGWDPKENGALIIVLWNALVLHARWGKMIGPVGLSALAVGGNAVTTWSWFGVNELDVGLHSYGASESNTAVYLLGFVVSQLVVMALAMLPPKMKAA